MENIIATCTICAKQFHVLDPLHPKGPRVPLVIDCGHPVCEKCLSSALHSNAKIVCSKCDRVSTGVLKANQSAQSFKELTQLYPIHHNILGKISDQFSQRPQRVSVDQSGIRFHPAGTSAIAPKTFNKYQSNQVYTQPRKMNPCSECQLQAMWTCKQCSTNFCGVCFNKVHQFKSNRSHDKVPMSYTVAVLEKEEIKDIELIKTQFMCHDHPSQKLDFYCRDCEQCVCSFCIVPLDSLHRTHNIVQVTKMNEECMPKLLRSITNANVVISNLIKSKKALESPNDPTKVLNPDETCASIDEVAQEVANFFGWVHGVMQQKEASILNTLREMKIEEQEVKKVVMQKVTSSIDHVKGLLKAAEDVACGKESACFSSIMPLVQDLDQLENLPCLLTIKKPNIKFSARGMIIEELSTLCDIEILSVQGMQLTKIGAVTEGWTTMALDESVPLDLSYSPSIASPCSSRAASVCESEASELPPADTYVPIRGFIPERTREVVKLCHMTNPANFFVLRIPDDRFLKDLSQKLQKSVVKQRQPIPNQIKEGQLLLVEYKSDHNWYRGLILSVRLLNDDGSDGLVEVVYIDYGNTDVVPMKRLRNLPPEFTNIPPLAIRCRLANIFPLGNTKSWSEEAIKFFAKSASDYPLMCTVYKVSNGFHWVDIGEVPGDTNRCVPLSITDALLFLEYGQMMNESLEPVPVDESRKPSLPKTVAIPHDTRFRAVLSHVDNPQHFYCQVIDDTTEYITLFTTELTTMFTRPKKQKGINNKEDALIYAPTIGMLCAAFYPEDGRWYRARVLARPGRRKVRVQYIDYGNTETVEYTQLRQLPDKYTRYPALSRLCSLADLAPADSEWSPQAKKYLVKLLTDVVLACRVVNAVIDTSLQLLIYDLRPTIDICINSLLVHVGLARSTGPAAEHPFKFIKHHDDSADLDYGLQLDSLLESEESESAMNQLMEEALSESSQPVLPKKKPTPKKDGFARMPVSISETDSESDYTLPKMPGGYTLVPKQEQRTKKAKKAVNGIVEKAMPEKSTNPYRMEVKVVKVLAPDSFFVAFMSALPHLENMHDEMNQFYEKSKPLKNQEWNLGDRCAVLVEKKKWHRGCCVKADVEGYMMVAMPDIPDKIYALLEDLRILDPRFMRIRDGALNCHLAGVTPAGARQWTKMAIEFMNSFLVKYKFEPVFISKKGEIEAGSLPVELTVRESFTPGPLDPTITRWISLNAELVEQGLAIPIRGAHQVVATPYDAVQELEDCSPDLLSLDIPVMPPAQMSEHSLNEDALDPESSEPDDLEITADGKLRDWLPVSPINMVAFYAVPTYVDNNGFIYFHDVIDGKKKIDEIQQRLQKMFSASKCSSNWKWSPGETCIAQYHLDKQWYRARTLSLEANGDWRVLFVDYGNDETCTLQEMRHSDYLAEYPIQCHKSFLENIGPIGLDKCWSVQALDFLHATVVEQKCTFYLKSPAGAPDPLQVQIQRDDGLDVSLDLLKNNFARRLNYRPRTAGVAYTSSPATATRPTGATKKTSPKKPSKKVADTIAPTQGRYQRVDSSSSEESANENKFESEIELHSNQSKPTLKTWYDESLGQDEMDRKWPKNFEKAIKETFHSSCEDVTSAEENDECRFSQLFYLDPSRPYPYRLLTLPAQMDMPILVRGVLSPTEVIIHLTGSDAMELMIEIKALETMLAIEAPKQPQLFKPTAGTACVANFAADDGDRWYRGVITGVSSSGNQIGVLSVDRGHTRVMPATSVLQLKPEWATLSALLLRAQLALKYKGNMPDDTIIQMLNLLTPKELTASVKQREPLVIQLMELDGKTLAYQTFIDAGEYSE